MVWSSPFLLGSAETVDEMEEEEEEVTPSFMSYESRRVHTSRVVEELCNAEEVKSRRDLVVKRGATGPLLQSLVT